MTKSLAVIEGFDRTIKTLHNLLLTIDKKFGDLDVTLDTHIGNVKEAIQDMYSLGRPVLGDENVLPDYLNSSFQNSNGLSSDAQDTSGSQTPVFTSPLLREILKTQSSQLGSQNINNPERFLFEADQAMHNGAPTAALLIAGLGFENALRRYAEVNEIVPQRGLYWLVKQLQHILSKEDSEQFKALTTIRNRLAHAELTDLPSQNEAESVLDRYSWAIRNLGRLTQSKHQ